MGAAANGWVGEGFRMSARRDLSARAEGRRPKASQEGTRGGLAVLPRAWGDGGPRGAPPRPKLSTMIMRPPQQGHGGRWSAAAPAATSASSCSVDGSIDGRGAAISSLARAMLALQVALASNP